jgi:hypothetical protein
VIPGDWARTDAPGSFAFPAEAEALTTRYTRNAKSIQLGSLLDYAEDLGTDRVYVEAPYVDWDYRSEYSNLYSRSFNPPSDKCERLLFFSGDHFVGFCVGRPSYKPVGRTAIAPPPSLAPFVSCLASHIVRPYGQEFQVDAWPFLSQDGIYGRCAHAAIWAIARYHHLRHGGARHSIAAVVEASGTRPSVDKTFQSTGLYLHQVAAAFGGLGLPAMTYSPNDLPSGQDLEAIVCRYLNSGFPVALSTPRHLTALIGYGHKDDKLFFIRSDDNLGPYERVEIWEEGRDRLREWEMLLVPLPARIHVPCEAAEIAARLIFLQQAGATAETEPYADAHAAGKLRVRTYAIEAAEYKAKLPARGLGHETVLHHQRTPASVWIWVTEFQRRDVQGKRRVVGEVAIDATSHPRQPQPVFANLPGRAVAWLPEDPVPRARTVPVLDLYDSELEQRVDV